MSLQSSGPQHLEALATANRLRIEAAALRRDVKAGIVTLPAALADPRAGSLTVFALLKSRAGMGRIRVLTILRGHHVSESRRVRELTDRQRTVLAADSRLLVRRRPRSAA